MEPDGTDLFPKKVQHLELDVAHVSLDRILLHLGRVQLIEHVWIVALRSEALDKFDEGNLELSSAVADLPQLLGVLMLKRVEPLRHLVHIVLPENLIHLLVGDLLPGTIDLLRVLGGLDAIKAAEANASIGGF